MFSLLTQSKEKQFFSFLLSQIKTKNELNALKTDYLQLILTSLALAILEEKFKDKMGEWKLIKQKGTKWIKKTKKEMSDYLANVAQDGSEDYNHIFDFIEIEKQALASVKIA